MDASCRSSLDDPEVKVRGGAADGIVVGWVQPSILG